MFLQETHLKRTAHVRLRCKWIGQIYHSNFSAKSRGTAILILKGVPFKHNLTMSDEEGRYVIVVGEVFSVPLTLVNVYGPNCDNPEFFKKVFDLIPSISDTNLIIGGDFNCVLDPYLDKSSTKIVSSNSSKFLNAYISNSNMFDVWRILYPSAREYSFHSQVHNIYTRIDYLILDGKLMPKVCTAKYHNIVISDHSPVTFSIKIDNMEKPQRNWRLNSPLLTNKVFINHLKRDIKMFFELNDKLDISMGVLWDTFKAYIRGCIISYQAFQRKRNRAEAEVLEIQIRELDVENAKHPCIEKYKKICALKYKLNEILTSKISKSFQYVKQKYFEFGDKPQKLLARQLHKTASELTIYKIKSDTGEFLTSSKDINSRFQTFYETLYSSKGNIDPTVMAKFLDQQNLPSLNQEQVEELGTEITIKEISDIIKSLKGCKTAGPDGFCNEFYKAYNELLSPYLYRVYKQASIDQSLPSSLNEAIIIVVPKKGRNPEELGSFRPISLLNTDQKILAKTLARRLNTVIRNLVHPDQNGFIPKRNSSSNLRRLFNIMYSSRALAQDFAILSLDAEKVFDQIEWPYLFAVLKKFNLGDHFISWIKLLYSSPCARILTNQTISSRFELHRGTRQVVRCHHFCLH